RRGPAINTVIAGVCSHFFFQAEDGIRDATVTGVQTCALPILHQSMTTCRVQSLRLCRSDCTRQVVMLWCTTINVETMQLVGKHRSEERRVGKECRSWWWQRKAKKKDDEYKGRDIKTKRIERIG